MGTRGRTFLGSEAASDTSRPRPARRRGGDSWAELNSTRRFAVVPPNARPRRLGGRPPLITLWRALRGNFRKHRRIAVWTWPIWIYVSATGVVVYLMCYQL